MKFKNILTAGLLSLGIAVGLMSCSSDEDPFFTASPSDSPRILNTDIPQGKNGVAEKFSTIDRTQNFTYELIVTPVEGASVEWFIDDEKVAEGLSIDTHLEVGVHTVKVVAKTLGGETSRTFTITVQPLETDPVLANKSKERLVKPGAEATMHGKNLQDVVKLLIGTTTVDCVCNEDGYLEYTVPEGLAEGVYDLRVIDKDGNSYVGGQIELSKNPVFSEIEVELWSGEFDVTWATPFEVLKAKTEAWASNGILNPGVVVNITVTAKKDDAQGCVATSWWRNIVTGYSDDDEGRGDDKISGTMVLSYELNETSINILVEQKGMLVVGNNYTLTKVTFVGNDLDALEEELEKENSNKESEPKTDPEPTPEPTPEPEATPEPVLVVGEDVEVWSGEVTVTWSTTFDGVKEYTYNKIKDGTIKIGTVLRFYVEGEGQGCITNTSWANILTGGTKDNRGDTQISSTTEYLEVTLTEESLTLAVENNNWGIIAVGDGYKVTKVEINIAE